MVRLFWLICGMVALVLGVIGILLPVVPATPFLLVSAVAFSKSSKTFYNYMLNNQYIGPVVKNWQTNRTIPLKAVITGIIMMSISLISIIIYFRK